MNNLRLVGASWPWKRRIHRLELFRRQCQRKRHSVFLDMRHRTGTDYPTPDGTCIRDYIYVSDLVRAHWNALGYLRAGGRSLTLNCGYGRGFSVLEVLNTVKRMSGVDLWVENAPRRPGDPVKIVAESKLIRETLGWRPRFDDLCAIIAHALAWERAMARLGNNAN